MNLLSRALKSPLEGGMQGLSGKKDRTLKHSLRAVFQLRRLGISPQLVLFVLGGLDLFCLSQPKLSLLLTGDHARGTCEPIL